MTTILLMTLPADMAEIRKFCDPVGIAVAEDASCAIGATEVLFDAVR